MMVLFVFGVCYALSVRQERAAQRVMAFACVVATLVVTYSFGRLCRLMLA